MRIVALFCGFTALATAAPPALPDSADAAYPAIERFVEVLEAVRTRHPDLDKLAYDRLVNHALEGMLSSLDPHSSFIHPEMAQLMEAQQGLDPGVPSLGLTLGLRDDGPYISAVAPLGPAAAAGVLPGSGILEINGRNARDTSIPELLAMLARPPGEKSTFLLKSPAAPRPLDIELVHRRVDQRSVAEAKMWDSTRHVGYLRLATFGANSGREMEAALDELEDEGMKSLILDLRGNGGGSLDQTVKILGQLLPPATAVVTTRGRDGESEPMKTPDRQRRRREYPVAILIDRMSASASELTAGALQDLKRATVVGETSYGKGSVQNILPMGGGTALRLTIATYHTPSGRTPDRKGITPDVVVPIDDETRTNFAKRCTPSALPPGEQKSLDAWDDPVIAAALKALP